MTVELRRMGHVDVGALQMNAVELRSITRFVGGGDVCVPPMTVELRRMGHVDVGALQMNAVELRSITHPSQRREGWATRFVGGAEVCVPPMTVRLSWMGHGGCSGDLGGVRSDCAR